MITGHSSPISGVAASPNGRWVATAGYDNRVYVWDPRNKTPHAVSRHDHLANMCTFSPDGDFLATAGSDHTARLWRVPDLKLIAVLADHEDDVEMVAFDPLGERLASASRDHGVRVFDCGGRLLARMNGHAADAISVAWSADGREVTSSSDDGTVRVWDAATGRQLGMVDMEGVETDSTVVGPEGTIYAGDDEGSIAIISGGVMNRVPAHRAGIKRLILGKNRLVSLSYDRKCIVWDVGPDGISQALVTELPDTIWPRSCAFLGDEKLVFGTFGTSYATFDLKAESWDLFGVDPTGGVNAVAWIDNTILTVGDAGIVKRDGCPIRDLGSLCNFLTPFGCAVLTGGQTGRVFDALNGDVLYTHRAPLNCGATFVTEGVQRAVVGAYTGEGIVFRADASGRPVFESLIQLHPNAVKGVAAGGEVIFSVCATGAAAWTSAFGLRSLCQTDRGHDKIANGCVALGSEGFASVSRDRKLRLWAPDGRLFDVINTPHTHSIKCVTASADGMLVATASYNGRVAVYDRRQRTWVFDRRLTTSGVSSLAARDRGFLAGSYDGFVYPIEESSFRFQQQS